MYLFFCTGFILGNFPGHRWSSSKARNSSILSANYSRRSAAGPTAPGSKICQTFFFPRDVVLGVPRPCVLQLFASLIYKQKALVFKVPCFWCQLQNTDCYWFICSIPVLKADKKKHWFSEMLFQTNFSLFWTNFLLFFRRSIPEKIDIFGNFLQPFCHKDAPFCT